jgi:hypothetical protein
LATEGLMGSENGWEPARCGPDALEWITVPGTNVHLQLLRGWPLSVMRAVAADVHAYIEPLRDADSAAWTPTNSVATSNHLNGTAMDLNWDNHPFHVRGTFNATQMGVLRELLDFYEDTIFWAGDWNDPIDEMHWQMGYHTFNNPHTADFIARKIRPDGLSTFRRGSAVVLSKKDQYALATIREGQRLNITPKGIRIALAVELVETNLTMYANRNVPASLALPHDAVGSDHDSTGLFQQRQAWGPLSSTMDPTLSARLFFLGGNAGQRGLTDFDYNSDSRTPGGWAQAVQVSAFPDRYDERMDEAQQLYDRLVGGTVPPPIQQGDDMALVPQEQWDNFYHAYMNDVPSLSPLRALGEGPIGPVHRILRNIDSSEHVEVVALLARLGHPPTIALLRTIAEADPTKYPDRQQDRLLAQAILSGQTAAPDPAPTPPAPAAPAPAPPTPPVATPPPPPADQQMTGRSIGDVYNALVALQLNKNLPAEVAAPLAALVGILSSYPTESA